jgi:biopolymer transport protein ExbD
MKTSSPNPSLCGERDDVVVGAGSRTSPGNPPAPVPVGGYPRVRRTFGLHPNYLDIMCCLVLVFLLTSLLVDTTKRVQEQNLPPVDLPQLTPAASGQKANETPPPAIVTVKPGPEYLLGNRKVPLPHLGQALKDSRLREVEIRGDQASQYGHVMNAMQACREAGIVQVALTYQTKEP